MVICLERGLDLHTAQLMPLPLTVSCFSKTQTGFTFLILAHPGSPGKRPLNGRVFQWEVPLFLEVPEFPYNTVYDTYMETRPTASSPWSECTGCHQQGHAGSKTLHSQNPPVLNWRCRLTQADLHNGRKTVVVVVVQFRIDQRKLPHQNQLYLSSRFSIVPACDGQTEGRMDRHTMTAYTILA